MSTYLFIFYTYFKRSKRGKNILNNNYHYLNKKIKQKHYKNKHDFFLMNLQTYLILYSNRSIGKYGNL